MPLQLPVLDDRNFEQLLAEAKRRIPVHTPEWTNFAGESDPGITLVELFAFLTDNLLYRANRIPERNRLKFLQLLGIPLQPAAAARGIVTIRNERGPVAALPLDRGVVVAAGSVNYITRDGVTVLPLEARIYYKLKVAEDDPRYADFKARYEAVRVALEAAAEEDTTTAAEPVKLAFYESTPLSMPTPGNPDPVLDLEQETSDRAIYIALLAPKNVPLDTVRQAIGNEVLSIGVAPALSDTVPPLRPASLEAERAPMRRLVYEIADVEPGATTARYTRLKLVQERDVLSEVGIVQIQLPAAADIQTWQFDDPQMEGIEHFPPRVDDDALRERILTWIRVRLPAPGDASTEAPPQAARLTWAGINAARITQAVPVVNEMVGKGTGEPDQSYTLANRPILPDSMRLVVEGDDGRGLFWRRTEDLLAARMDEPVFALDPEAGTIRFGDGLRGARPQAGRRIVASYEYGGGRAGNVAIGAIKASPDTRLQGGFKIENPLPTWGGDMGETIAEAERNIPLELRHRNRLVTEQDYHDVARRTPGVDLGRVEVLALFRPRKDQPPETSAAGVVTVLVIPLYDAVRPRWPQPDRLFLRTVCDYLDQRRLVTTEIYVRGPEYIPVYVTVGIKVQAGHFPDVVRQDARARLYEYLSALPPGGPDGTGWPLSKRLLRKDLEAVVTRVDGVEFVRSLFMGVRDSSPKEDYLLSGLELPMLSGVDVTEGEAEPLATVVAGGSAAEMPVPDARVVPVPVSRTKC
jgi:predicted phage baseplate assembly protein